jgi:acetyltransferase-like isoleucine patch superfamily enzyme
VNLARTLVESPRSLRWHLARARTAALYRPAFAGLGSGSVIVRPHQLRGVDKITIGRDCAIYEGAWLAVEDGGGPLTIGDGTYLGHAVHLHAIDPVRIGSRCVLADGVYVTSTDHDRADRHRTHGTGPVTIGDGVFLGQRAVVLGGVTIGDGATVAAHAVVTRDVEAGAVVAGVPARPLPRAPQDGSPA